MFVKKNVFEKKENKIYKIPTQFYENVVYGDLETFIIEFLKKSKSCPPKKLYKSTSFKKKLHKFLIEEVNFMAERIQKKIKEKGLCAFTQILSDELKRTEEFIRILKKYDAICFIGENEKILNGGFIIEKECCLKIENKCSEILSEEILNV